MTTPSPLIRGTLEAMILRTLRARALHGYGVARAIEAAAGGRLAIEEGSLYPALHRLARRGDVKAEWRISETGRRARFYTLTPRGEKRLAAATREWADLAGAVSSVLGAGPKGVPA